MTTELPALRSQVSREQGDSQKPSSGTTNTNTGTRKWPSFTMRRPGRLSSTSSASASGTASTSSSTHGARSTTSKSKLTTTPCSPAQDGIGSSSLLRSFSAERHRIAVVTTPTTPTCKVDPATPTNTGSPQKPFVMRSSSSPYRKASVRPDGGGFGHPDRIDSVESSSGDPHRNSMRLQKTKKVFSNFFFGKHSKKGRGSGGSSNTSHHPLPPSQISLPPASVQQASLSTNPRIDSLPPPHPAPMADISSECSS
ncbi:unnamed protein product [Hymenolepis diminuta]|uniref:Uncharacterized protein n=1 Tax=Hymenolepis diminuta TaxID=6216 RepID=A0A3P7BG98_HYMDI|nr:unnamed protein product [Hymenolepis diminuta]